MTSTPMLATDAYKFSMAQAGFPLRRETFYFSFRRGGMQFVPMDLVATVRAMIEGIELEPHALAFARDHGYAPTTAMEAALVAIDQVEIEAVPAGSWVCEREPILCITGPSFLVSWLEPMLLWLNHPIQVATHVRSGRELSSDILTATCGEHEAILLEVLETVGGPSVEIVREDEAYVARVRAAVRELIAIVGSPDRIFEVGMRSAVCMEQHRLALEACRAEGVLRTSNVHLAHELSMIPVGTMGHEHVQRWGSDRSAFEAMRDMRTSAPSYLLDTFDTMGSGIRAAMEVMRERPHPCSIRYDSGNKFVQYLHACELLREEGLSPAHVLEDALDAEATRHFESLRAFTGLPEDAQVYGYGGSIVASPMTHPLTRDRVSAVYKLAKTGAAPRMKFGNETGLGKQSVPGHPVVWRRIRGDGPLGMIGQMGERVPEDYVLLSGNPEALEQLRLCNVLDFARALGHPLEYQRVQYSPETRSLVEQVMRLRGG